MILRMQEQGYNTVTKLAVKGFNYASNMVMQTAIRVSWIKYLFFYVYLTYKNQIKYLKPYSGKSLLEALILASTNPKYNKKMFIDLPVQYMKTASSEHVVLMNCFECQNKKKQYLYTICCELVFRGI